jgi:lactoylglutathione lyase
MTRYLHVMYRITDPEKSRAFYEALGFEFRREVPIVRDGQLEATNYFFGVPGQDEELELTYNHDGRTYELAPGTGTSLLESTTSTGHSRASASNGSNPSGSHTESAPVGLGSVSSKIRTGTTSSS